jgi:hypothetical protein
MDDSWEIFVQSTNDEELVTLSATAIVGDIGGHLTLLYSSATCIREGILGKSLIRYNGKTVAEIDYSGPTLGPQQSVFKGQVLPGSHMYITPDLWVNTAPPKKKVVCTCGAAAVYGRDTNLHMDNVANTCELVLEARGLL